MAEIARTLPDAKAWEKSAAAFRADRKALCDLINNESTDLFAKIPHGDGQTILRQVLLAADHNAYHIGELEFFCVTHSGKRLGLAARALGVRHGVWFASAADCHLKERKRV